MHKALYNTTMPGCVLKAWTTCSQYTADESGVAAHRGMFLRVLHENVTELHSSGTSSHSNNKNTAIERLGRLHALMLYQTIRMFDGDITLSSQAANDMPLLEGWAADMLTLRDNLDGVVEGGGERPPPPETWEVRVCRFLHELHLQGTNSDRGYRDGCSPRVCGAHASWLSPLQHHGGSWLRRSPAVRRFMSPLDDPRYIACTRPP